jgi:hypothetical protein
MTWLDGAGGCSAPESCPLPLGAPATIANLQITANGSPISTAATQAPTTTAPPTTAPGYVSSSLSQLYTNPSTGDLTYYGTLSGIGNCAIPAPTSPPTWPSWTSQLSFAVAMNAQQYALADQCQACGICIRGTYLGTGSGANPPPATFTALVADQCPGVCFFLCLSLSFFLTRTFWSFLFFFFHQSLGRPYSFGLVMILSDEDEVY